MRVFPMLAVSFIMNAVAVIFIICAVVLILVILIQKGKGGGLGAALGGGMAGGILGTKTGDFLTWLTISLVGLFLILAVVMDKLYRPAVSDFDTEVTTQQELPASPEQPRAPIVTGEFDEGADANSTDIR